MRKDNSSFRERFLRWKNGELVYENGRPIPHYANGKEGKTTYKIGVPGVDYDYSNVAWENKLDPVVVTGSKPKKEKPFWVSPYRLKPLDYSDLELGYTAATAGLLPNVLTAARNFAEGDILKGFVNLGWTNESWSLPALVLLNGKDVIVNVPTVSYGIVAPGILNGTGDAGANLPIFKGFGKNQFQAAVNAGKNLYRGYKISRAIDKAVDSETLARPMINTAYKNIRKPYIINLEREKNGVNIGINSGIKRDYNNPINNILSVLLQDKMLGEYVGRGAERQVFTDRRNPDRVIKIGGGLNGEEKITDFDLLNEAIDYTLEMNKLPSVEPISYEGFIEEGGQFIPWFSLKKVTPLNKVADPFHVFTKSYIMPNGKPVTGKLSAIRLLDRDKVFVPLGYNPVPTMPGAFSVHGYPYRVTDLGQKNIGLDSAGNIKIFDPMIEL